MDYTCTSELAEVIIVVLAQVSFTPVFAVPFTNRAFVHCKNCLVNLQLGQCTCTITLAESFVVNT